MAASSPQSFGPTSGLFTGWFSGALFLVAGVIVGLNGSVGWGALLLAVALVLWCFLARPRIVLDAGALELRNAFSSWVVPLAAIDDVSVRHATVVTVDGSTYVGDAVGLNALEVLRGTGSRGTPDRVVEAIQREKARIKGSGSRAVQKVYAVPQLVVLGILLLVFVVFGLF